MYFFWNMENVFLYKSLILKQKSVDTCCFSTCGELTCMVVVTQSSGIETLVEELCSRLKDLQSEQGERSAVEGRLHTAVVTSA